MPPDNTGYEEYIGSRMRPSREEDEDRGRGMSNISLLIAGQIALRLAGGAVQWMSKGGHIRLAQDIIKATEGSPLLKDIKKLMPIYEGTEQILRRGNVPKRVTKQMLSSRRLQVARDFEALSDMAGGRSPFAGAKDVVVSHALENMMKFGPQHVGEFRHVTLHDIVYGKNPALEKILGPEAIRVRAGFRSIMETSGGRAFMVKRNLNPELLSKGIKASQHLYRGKGKMGEVVDVGRFMPKNVLTWLGRFKFPFTDWKPFELLFPTEALYRQPNIMRMTGEYASSLLSKYNVGAESGIFAFGKIFPVTRPGVGRPAIVGAPLPGEFALGRKASGMGRAAAARLGIRPQFGTAERYLAAQKIITPALAEAAEKARAAGTPFSASRYIKGTQGLSLWQKTRIHAAVLGDKIKVGPQFAARKSLFVRALQRLTDMTKYKPTVTKEFPGVKVEDLTLFEKIKLGIGYEPSRTVIRQAPAGREMVDKVKIARFSEDMVSGRPIGSDRRFGEYYAYEVTPQGKLGRMPAEFGKPVRVMSDWFNYQMMRPFWLMEESIGLGIVPGKTALGTIGRALSVYGAYKVSTTALSYLDYQARRRDVPGPVTLGAMLYTKGRLAVQGTLEKIGVTDYARDLEEKYPGLIESPLSKGIRAAAFTLGGVYAGAAGLGMAGLAAGTLMGAMQLPNITQSAHELRMIYTGERDVPIYKNRWWLLGRSPWQGEAPMYFRPSWYPLLTSKAKSVGLWGSERERWKHSWFPTPESLLGLRPILDPYAKERRNYYTRPYPITGAIGASIPLIGSWLSRSRMFPFRYIKPEYRMHPEYWTDTGSIADMYLNTPAERAGWQLGYGYWPRFQRRSVKRTRLDQMVGEEIYKLSQWTGLTGFTASFLKNQVTGSEDWFDKRPQIATSNAMASVQRDFYDRDLGGALGMSEFSRRFIPRGRTHIEQYNPILNTLPNWLPGSKSIFERDRDNFQDAHMGDSYTRWKMGEARLPGKGFEALHRLHSGIPKHYDALDRFLILSDIAPNSDAYKHYHAIVKSWRNAGMLDSHWENKYQEALYQVDMRFKPPFEERRTGEMVDQDIVVKQLVGPTKFRGHDGAVYHLAGVEHDVERQAWKLRSRGKEEDRMNRGYSVLRSQLEDMVGRTVQAKVGSMGLGSSIPVIIPGINQGGLEGDIAGDVTDHISAQARFGRSASQQVWDSMRHLRIPGPAGWPITKFFGRRSAVEEYQLSELEGGDFAGWDHPYRNFVRFWGRQAYNTFAPDPMIPGDVKRRREVEEYFDKLKFLKYKNLERLSASKGMSDTASVHRDMWRKTMTGLSMNGANFYKDVWGAIPKTERKYFKAFANTSDGQTREKILKMVPEYMKPIYVGIWSRGPGSENVPRLPGPAIQNPQDFHAVQRNVQDFFKQFRLPDANWAGWDPTVDIEKTRIRTVSNIAQDYHDYQIWEGQVRDTEARGYPMAPFTEPVRDADSQVAHMMLGPIQRAARNASRDNAYYGNRNKRRRRRRVA